MTSKLAAALILALCATAAQAAVHYLTSSWNGGYRDSERMCMYDNGKVINVGPYSCPPSISD